MTMLRQVLQHFEQRSGAISLMQMARDLGVERAVLQDMLDYWVRKGRLREVQSSACGTCGCSSKGCSLMVVLPRMYELVRDDTPANLPIPACGCHRPN